MVFQKCLLISWIIISEIWIIHFSYLVDSAIFICSWIKVLHCNLFFFLVYVNPILFKFSPLIFTNIIFNGEFKTSLSWINHLFYVFFLVLLILIEGSLCIETLTLCGWPEFSYLIVNESYDGDLIMNHGLGHSKYFRFF